MEFHPFEIAISVDENIERGGEGIAVSGEVVLEVAVGSKIVDREDDVSWLDDACEAGVRGEVPVTRAPNSFVLRMSALGMCSPVPMSHRSFGARLLARQRRGAYQPSEEEEGTRGGWWAGEPVSEAPPWVNPIRKRKSP